MSAVAHKVYNNTYTSLSMLTGWSGMLQSREDFTRMGIEFGVAVFFFVKPGILFLVIEEKIESFLALSDSIDVVVIGEERWWMNASALVFRGGCMDLMGLIFVEELTTAPFLVVLGVDICDKLSRDVSARVCPGTRSADALSERGGRICSGTCSGTCSGRAGISGIDSLDPSSTASASPSIINTGPFFVTDPFPEADECHERRLIRMLLSKPLCGSLPSEDSAGTLQVELLSIEPY